MHTGLQVDCMHFPAEAATQNTKAVECYICLKYNHIAKYCKNKEQVCARCGESHRMDQCTVVNDAIKCCNCKGNHLATSNECPHYKEQEKRRLNLVNQYSTLGKAASTVPARHDLNEFPALPNMFQRQQEHFHSGLIDEIINVMSSKMEKMIEETTSRIFQKLQQQIKQIEKSFGILDNSHDAALTVSDSESSEEGLVIQHIKNQQKQRAEAAEAAQAAQAAQAVQATTVTSAKPSTTKATSKKAASKASKKGTKASKRVRSPNSSLDTSTMDNKDLKTSNNNDD